MTARLLVGVAAAAIVAGLNAHEARVPQPAAESLDLPARLADTGLLDAAGAVAPGVRPFAPQYPLWSDGLLKRRWMYLPPGGVIRATDDEAWEFPAGTKFWKEFSRAGQRIETRMLWKVTETRWAAASYVWATDGSGAMLADERGVPAVAELAPGRAHSIPSRSDCAACHGAATRPLGFTALQLSTDRDPNAIHGEPLQPGMLTVADLVRERALSPDRPDLVSNPPRIKTSDPASRAVLGYLAANCGVCHDGKGGISAAAPVIRARDLVIDGDAVARTLIGAPTRWQLPGHDGPTVVVQAGVPQLSALVARMRSRSPASQMPPLGTVLRDEEALHAISRWIATDLAATGISTRHGHGRAR